MRSVAATAADPERSRIPQFAPMASQVVYSGLHEAQYSPARFSTPAHTSKGSEAGGGVQGSLWWFVKSYKVLHTGLCKAQHSLAQGSTLDNPKAQRRVFRLACARLNSNTGFNTGLLQGSVLKWGGGARVGEGGGSGQSRARFSILQGSVQSSTILVRVGGGGRPAAVYQSVSFLWVFTPHRNQFGKSCGWFPFSHPSVPSWLVKV